MIHNLSATSIWMHHQQFVFHQCCSSTVVWHAWQQHTSTEAMKYRYHSRPDSSGIIGLEIMQHQQSYVVRAKKSSNYGPTCSTWSCCSRPLLSVANWKHFCSSLPMNTGKQTDDCFVMCPWSPSRGRNKNDSVTVTVNDTFLTLSCLATACQTTHESISSSVCTGMPNYLFSSVLIMWI